MVGKTLYEKIWDSHVVYSEPGQPSILYVDLHMIHEVTSPQAFDGLKNCAPIQKNMRDFSSNHLYVLKINFKKELMQEHKIFGVLQE